MSDQRQAKLTLHQLRIFWAIAHAETLTSAAKQLGIAQPSMSQQLSRLEMVVGTPLFERHGSSMVLTSAGSYLLPRAEQVLGEIEEIDAGLTPWREDGHATLRLAGITSMLRMLLPQAISHTIRQHPAVDFDIHDCAPSDILDLLHSRRARIGLLAASSVAQDAPGFHQVPLVDDPLLLAVPAALDLDDVTDPQGQLPPQALATLNRTIQFAFGSRQSRRVETWFRNVLPDHRVFTLCRSYEVALSLVAAGVGVCLAPTLAVMAAARERQAMRFYRVDELPRRLVALVAAQDRHRAPCTTLIEALCGAAAGVGRLETLPTPPFLRSRAEK